MQLIKFLSKYRLGVTPCAFFAIVRGYSADVLDETATFRYAFAALDRTALLMATYFSLLTTGQYLLNKVTDREEDERNVPDEAIERSSSVPVLVASLLLMFVPLIGVAISSPRHVGLYVGLLLLGIWYSCRIPFFSHRIRLKDVFVVKAVVTAINWAAVIVVVPALSRTVRADDAISFVEVFSLIMFMTLIWDVRDIQGDLLAGVRTVANVWGVPATKAICAVLLVVAAVIGVLHRRPLGLMFVPLVVTMIVTTVMVRPDRKPSFYIILGLMVWTDLLAAV